MQNLQKLLFFAILIVFVLAFFLLFDFGSSEDAVENTEITTTEQVPGTSQSITTEPPSAQSTIVTSTEIESTTASQGATTPSLTTTAPSTTTPNTTAEPPETSVPPASPTPEGQAWLIEALSKARSQHVFVYDVTNKALLGEVSQTDKIYPASITKLLTALYALEVMPADTKITPGDELSLVLPGSSIAYVQSHHTLTLEMLVEGMLLPSGNDAAYVVAAATARHLANDPSLSGEDAVAYFMTELNAYAKRLGCTNTHFTVPDGYAGNEHYTCSHDLILIGEKALQNEIIAKYAALPTDSVVYASGHLMTWNNTNQLLKETSKHYSPYVNGLKTGSLSGYYCVYVSAEINGTTYLIGVFGAPESAARYTDTHLVLDALLTLND